MPPDLFFSLRRGTLVITRALSRSLPPVAWSCPKPGRIADEGAVKRTTARRTLGGGGGDRLVVYRLAAAILVCDGRGNTRLLP